MALSRAKRMAKIVEAVRIQSNAIESAALAIEDLKGEVEALKDELESWRDNMPENMQGGDKWSEIDEACSALDTIIDTMGELDDLKDAFVDLPGEMEAVEFPSR